MKCEEQVENCGGNRKSLSGTLRFPLDSTSAREESSRCSWKIQTIQNKVLNVTFVNFDVQTFVDCRYNYVQVKF